MTQLELEALLKTTGYPVGSMVFQTVQTPPYIIYLAGETIDEYANNRKVFSVTRYAVELYTGRKRNIEAESKLEQVLTAAEINFTKAYAYFKDEETYQILYEFSLIGG